MSSPEQPHDKTNAGGSLRPAGAELPSDELGSTEQFRAFANGDDDDASAADRGALGNERARPQPEVVLPEDHDPRSSEVMGAATPSAAQIQPSDLPPVNPDAKRNLYIAIGVLVLVIVVVALLLILG
ncbi:hypothetical protein [Cumulibacter manganitolerans]|uniref:hypothetical protein n=1 Tax=Cumulibacter manganitolerans TaxID=1884992 RepID=UPI001295B0BE|nr:hypothetical protein [Cumulibacter manganitolerans]